VRETAVQRAFFVAGRDAWRRHKVVTVAGDVGGLEKVASKCGYDVGLRWDDEKVSVDLLVRGPMVGLSKKGEPSGGRMEVYVDMRPRKGRTNAYEFGVDQLLLCLEGTEYGTTSRKRYGLNIRNERTSDGCRILFDLPFADFMKPDWERPRVIGLDFMSVISNEAGAEIGYSVYGGRGGLYSNPILFSRAFLV
jgi:hypothetical protein